MTYLIYLLYVKKSYPSSISSDNELGKYDSPQTLSELASSWALSKAFWA